MRPLALFLFFWASCVVAAPLSVIPVGDFGGYRVKTACFFGATPRICTLDTMGSVSVISEGPDFSRYEVKGHEKVSGIGVELSCDVVDVTDFAMLGIPAGRLLPLRCADENSSFPLIGLPFFDRRTFLFDFPGSSLLWDAPESAPLPLLRIGGEKLWIAMKGTFASENVIVAFDTGNPVTIVTREFADAHPAQLQMSLKPISPGLLNKGLVPFEMRAPIVIDGVELKADYVYAGSKFPALIFEQAGIILGMNHAVKARWWFDLARDQYRVSQ